MAGRLQAAIAALIGAFLAGSPALAQSPSSPPFYPPDLNAATLAGLVDARLTQARAALDRLVAARPPRTAANTLRPFDDANNEWEAARGLAGIATQVHPDSSVRAEGVRAEERVNRFRSEFDADPQVARAFAELDTTRLTPEERRLVARTLRVYRRAGADRDEAARARFRSLFETLERLSDRFQANLARDTTKVAATPDEVAGMPPDWVQAHERDAQGRVILTTTWSDIGAVTAYSLSRPLRKRMMIAFYRRGWPVNAVVLDSLLRVREEVAHLAGSPNWAAYQAETRMAGSPEAIRAFIARLQETAQPAWKRLDARYRERLRRDDPSLTRLELSDFSLAAELIRREQFSVDKREIRSYFPFERVKQGVLAVASEFFGVEFRPVQVPVWHPSVEAYEVRQQGRLIGRFYMDLHPRPEKVPFGATFDLRAGITGRQLPEAMLVARFPGGTPGDPGLMDVTGVTGVTTFFHEFGHVMHWILSSRSYASTGGWPEELDFVEVPSLMLEELVQQPAVLRRLSGRVEDGAPIPDELLQRMRAADAFSRPMQVAQYAALSTLSLELHDHPAGQVDPDSLARRAFASNLGVDLDPEMHVPTSFDHIGAAPYSSAYYTFLWSQVIAKDLWSAFDPAHPLQARTIRRYRDTILRPGKSRPAAESVRQFLGRPFALASWQRWLEGGSRD
jgi:thimet oligopeptidase